MVNVNTNAHDSNHVDDKALRGELVNLDNQHWNADDEIYKPDDDIY